MRALDQVDDLKMQLPTLGPVVSGDFAEAQNAELPAEMSSVEAVTSDLVSYLRGITISSHPHTQQNVIAPPTIPSLIGVLLASLHNPNIAWDEYSRLVALAEVEAVGITARMVGYDPTTSWRHVYLWRDWHHALRGKDRSGKSLPPGYGPRCTQRCSGPRF